MRRPLSTATPRYRGNNTATSSPSACKAAGSDPITSASPPVVANRLANEDGLLFKELSTKEAESSQNLSNIMDDMQAYFERRRFVQFKAVLDDMRQQDVIGGLRQLGDDLPKENGLSMAQCEYWSDTLDRWAEDLVEPASGGT